MTKKTSLAGITTAALYLTATVPMIILWQIVPGLFFRDGTAPFFVLFLAWPVIAEFAFIKICFKQGKLDRRICTAFSIVLFLAIFLLLLVI
jgi:hypothetical protein